MRSAIMKNKEKMTVLYCTHFQDMFHSNMELFARKVICHPLPGSNEKYEGQAPCIT